MKGTEPKPKPKPKPAAAKPKPKPAARPKPRGAPEWEGDEDGGMDDEFAGGDELRGAGPQWKGLKKRRSGGLTSGGKLTRGQRE